jgi:hypothetical protein
MRQIQISKSLPVRRAGKYQMNVKAQIPKLFDIWTFDLIWPASAPSRPSGMGGVKGQNANGISLPGSVALWAQKASYLNFDVCNSFS